MIFVEVDRLKVTFRMYRFKGWNKVGKFTANVSVACTAVNDLADTPLIFMNFFFFLVKIEEISYTI